MIFFHGKESLQIQLKHLLIYFQAQNLFIRIIQEYLSFLISSLLFFYSIYFQKISNSFILARLFEFLYYFLQMGNENSPSNYQKFQQNDWVLNEQLPDFKIWRSKKEPFQRIEQHEIYAHNDNQTNNEKKIFELRRRNPLLVAAYYLQSQPRKQFCSFYSQHTLYLERIPLRLCDIEHVPYPDYLHLYDTCLKGYAQLARSVGYFPINQAMIGINERGIAKVWLNQDFAKSSPINLKINQENMVRSLIDSIDRSIDSELLPSSVPSVHNFLYKNSDSINFDTAIWSLGQFIRNYNSSQIPIKLDCIERVGGIYAIANRQSSSKLVRSSVSNRQLDRSNVSNHQHQKISNNIKALATEQGVHTGPLPVFKTVKSESQLKAQQIFMSEQMRIQDVRFINQPTQQQYYVSNAYIPQPTTLVSQYRPSPNYAYANNNTVFIPNLSQNHRIISSQASRNNILVNVNTEQKIVLPSPIRNSQHLAQQLPFSTPQRNVQQPIFTPRVMNAPKFTVQVIPGKVYPQKSSTIFKQSSSKVVPANVSEKQISLLEQNFPILTTSQKYVEINQKTVTLQANELKRPSIQQQRQVEDQIIEHVQIENAQSPQKVEQKITFIQNEQVIEDTEVNLDDKQVLQLEQNELAIESNGQLQNQLIVSFNPNTRSSKEDTNHFYQSYQSYPVNQQSNIEVDQIANNVPNHQFDYDEIEQPKESYNFNYNQSHNAFSLKPQFDRIEPQQRDYNAYSKFQLDYGNYQEQQNNTQQYAFNYKPKNTFETQEDGLTYQQFNSQNIHSYYNSTDNPIVVKDYSSIVKDEGKNSYKFISQTSEFQDINRKPLNKESMSPSSYSDYLNNLVSQSNEIYSNNYMASNKSIIDSLGSAKYVPYSYKGQYTGV